MSDDIVAQLREEGFITHVARLPRESKVLHAAADEIERLRVERDEARQLALKYWLIAEWRSEKEYGSYTVADRLLDEYNTTYGKVPPIYYDQPRPSFTKETP